MKTVAWEEFKADPGIVVRETEPVRLVDADGRTLTVVVTPVDPAEVSSEPSGPAAITTGRQRFKVLPCPLEPGEREHLERQRRRIKQELRELMYRHELCLEWLATGIRERLVRVEEREGVLVRRDTGEAVEDMPKEATR